VPKLVRKKEGKSEKSSRILIVASYFSVSLFILFVAQQD
jgi:hypothetical protein